jgi:hypothetical protein
MMLILTMIQVRKIGVDIPNFVPHICAEEEHNVGHLLCWILQLSMLVYFTTTQSHRSAKWLGFST